MKKPLVSILMPAYNAENFIAEAMGSVLSQDHESWELLVLDDASSDSTLQIIKSFSDDRIKLFSNEKNEGYLKSCNRLFGLATGDFITFLDADDTCPTNRLSACLAAFEVDSELGFLTTNHSRFDTKHERISNQLIDYSRYAIDPKYAPTICCATVFVKSDLLNQVGNYHPFFDRMGGEDYYWLYKLSVAGNGIHLSEPLYCYRQHSSQTHIQHSNPLKYFITDVIEEIRIADRSGTDLLCNPSVLEQRWKAKLNNEPALLLIRKASEALNLNRKSEFWKFWKLAFLSSPHSTIKLRQSIYLLYSYFARIA